MFWGLVLGGWGGGGVLEPGLEEGVGDVGGGEIVAVHLGL